MEKYIRIGSAKTPEISFDLISGNLEIKGRSYPEVGHDFYMPLMNAIDLYATCLNPVTTITIDLECFSTNSSKCLLDILRKFEKIRRSGNTVLVNWCYDDEDILEAGEEYQSIIDIPFQMVQVAN